MIKLRNNVFETNSSSSHSLVYSKQNREEKCPLELDPCEDDVENGLLCVRFGEFGWGPEILKSPRDKLSYVMTQVANDEIDWDKREELSWSELQEILDQNKSIQHILSIVQFHVPGVKGFKYLRPGEDLDSDKEPKYGYSYPLGYIDHQSYGMIHEEDPEDLIFNPGIIILIDNDNSCSFEKYYNNYDSNWRRTLPPDNDPEELWDLTGYDHKNYYGFW